MASTRVTDIYANSRTHSEENMDELVYRFGGSPTHHDIEDESSYSFQEYDQEEDEPYESLFSL